MPNFGLHLGAGIGLARGQARRRAAAAAPGLPVPGDSPANTGPGAVGIQQTGSNGTWSGSGLAFTYAWLRDGVPIPGATAINYTPTSSDFTVEVMLRVTATNTAGSASAESAPVLVAYDVPANTAAPVAGPSGGTYVSTAGTWYGNPGSYSFQWFLDGSPLAGESSSVLASPESLPHETTLQCRVTAENPSGSASEFSNPYVHLIPAPENTASPVATFGAGTYSCSNGTWNSASGSFSYQWYLNDSPIPDETAATLADPGVLADGDLIHCVVTASNAGGSTDAPSNVLMHQAAVYGTVYWLDNSDNEDGFRIEWGTDGTSFPASITVGPDLSTYEVPFPDPGTYHVRVIAFNQVTGDSAPSNVAVITVS